jgi:RNA polymerase sigma-70 factor (ECF subfamily)
VSEEAALVQRCLGGEEAAARELVERFQALVFSLCFRMLGQREDAEDVAQDVFLRTFRSLKAWDPQRSLKPWILAIAANRCRTALKQRPRNAGRSLLVNQAVAAGSSDSRDLADELENAVGELRDDYRLCFLLFYQDDLSCAEIADVMSCPEGTVKTWLHRARRELAERLRRRGVVPHVEYQLHRV